MSAILHFRTWREFPKVEFGWIFLGASGDHIEGFCAKICLLGKMSGFSKFYVDFYSTKSITLTLLLSSDTFRLIKWMAMEHTMIINWNNNDKRLLRSIWTAIVLISMFWLMHWWGSSEQNIRNRYVVHLKKTKKTVSKFLKATN